MTQPPGSSGSGFGESPPEEPQVPPASSQPPQWGTPPPGYYQPPPGGYQPPPGQYPTPPPTWGQPAFGLSPQEERTWGLFAHIGALIAGFVVGFSFLGPLVVLLTQGPKSAFVRRHAVESLNFHLTALMTGIVFAVLSILAVVVTVGVALLVVIPAFIAGVIATVVFTVLGGIRANQGQDYRYPVNIRMVK